MAGLQSVDLHGYWWLPENESHQVAGHLTISPEESRLFLYGSLEPERHGVFSEPGQALGKGSDLLAKPGRQGTYARVHGAVGHTEVTLDDCFETHHDRTGVPTGDRQTLHVGRAIQGVLLDEGAPVEASRIVVRLKYLTNWLAPTEIEQDDGPSGPAGYRSRMSLTVEAQPPQTVPLPGGGELRLHHELLANGSWVTSRTLQQQYLAEVVPNELTALDDLVDKVSDLQDLVSIATRRSAELEQVTFFHPGATWPADDDDAGTQMPLQLHHRIQVVDHAPDEQEPHPFNFLFSVEEIGGLDGIARWMAVAEVNRDTLGRTMAVSYSKGMFVSDRFLNYIAALEGYDKVQNPTAKQHLAGALHRCVRKAGQPFVELVGRPSKWVDLVVDHRHDIAHHKGKYFRGSSGDQHFLGEAGYWLNLLCLLRDAEAPGAVFERICKHGDFTFLQGRLQAILAVSS